MKNTGQQAHELKQTGLSWKQVGEKLGASAESVRSKARRFRGLDTQDTKSIENRVGAKIAHGKVAEQHGLSEGELRAILQSAKGKPAPKRKAKMPQATASIKMLVMSDTHIGHEKFHEPLFESAVQDAKDCDVVLHPGDHLEGMSGRPGHIYELTEVGYAAQIKKCRQLYSAIDVPMYGIDGNHDQWFKQKNNAGAIVGEELDATLPRYTHLGEWEGDLDLNGLKIKLFHAGDGSAYAHSYKMQKLIESFSGGEKPHIVFSGHYHKAIYQFSRNVHGFESGTICGQSRFMRGKKLQAHMGYWIVTAYYGREGVARLASEWIPWYE